MNTDFYIQWEIDKKAARISKHIIDARLVVRSRGRRILRSMLRRGFRPQGRRD